MEHDRVSFIDRQTPPHPVEILGEETDIVPRHSILCLELLEIFEIWSSHPREACGLPSWDQFDAEVNAQFKPKLSLMHVGDWRKDDFEYVFYGEHPATFINRGNPLVMSALRVDPQRRANYDDMKVRIGRCVETGKAGYVHKTLSWSGAGYIAYEVIFLPFAKRDGIQPILTPTSAYAVATPFGELPV